MTFDRRSYLESKSPIKKLLLKLFKQTDELNIFDIGACEGEESIKYKNIFPNSSIFLFEPLPKNQELILQNIKTHNLQNVTLIAAALSNTNGITKFYTSSGHPQDVQMDLDWDFGNKSSSLLPPQLENMPKWLNFNEVIKVQTMTLDAYLEDNKIEYIDFVHMDVQGAELKVLVGAKEKIKNIKAVWLEVSNIELYQEQPLTDEIEMFMNNNNFYLVKSEFSGEFGDRFYLNKRYFKTLFSFKNKIQFHFKVTTSN